MRATLLLVALLAPLAEAQTEAEILRHAQDSEAVVERIRELKFKGPVKMTLLTDEQVRKRMEEEYDEDLPKDKAAGLEAAYARMGLIPADMDLRQTMFELELSEVAAFYDQKKRELCLLTKTKDEPDDTLPVKWTDLVAVHELTHALQDQLHDLRHLDDLPLEKDDSDVSFALSCVLEGEANLVMMGKLYEAMGRNAPGVEGIESAARAMFDDPSDKDSPLAKAPHFLRESLVLPYVAGLRFVAEVKEKKGWAGVGDLLVHLPSSSEQILHPKKFLAERQDLPVAVRLPDLSARLPKGWREVAHDSLGELGIRIRLEEEKVPVSLAHAASEGWGGDEFVAWNDGQKAHTALAWATTWDAETDAKRFFYALRDALARRYRVAQKDVPKGETALAWDTEAGGAAIELRGKDVVSIEAFPGGAAAAKDALAALWAGLEKKEVTAVEEKK